MTLPFVNSVRLPNARHYTLFVYANVQYRLLASCRQPPDHC